MLTEAQVTSEVEDMLLGDLTRAESTVSEAKLFPGKAVIFRDTNAGLWFLTYDKGADLFTLV